MAAELQVDVSAGVAVLTLNRPAQQNAFTPALGAALSTAFRRCDQEDAIRAVVVTGTPPAFCAGSDLSAKSRGEGGLPAAGAAINPPAWALRKPVIAAVNGHAVGIGLALALQCDMRFMASDAVYGLVQARRGALADGCVHWTLPRLIGVANAADLLLTGRTFDGEEARAMGMANAVLPAEEVLPAALSVAEDLARSSAPLSVGLSKRLLWEGQFMEPARVAQLENEFQHHIAGQGDAAEGVAAYLERRPPNWTGSVSTAWPKWDQGRTPGTSQVSAG